MNRYTKQGAPTHHGQSAQSHAAKSNVPRQMRYPAEIAREKQMRAFRIGALLGFIAAATVFGVVLWAWVIPTMDAAIDTARGMVM